MGGNMGDTGKCSVKHYRTYAGISQRALSRMAGTSASTICEIESGKRLPTVALAIRISRALGRTVEELWEAD